MLFNIYDSLLIDNYLIFYNFFVLSYLSIGFSLDGYSNIINIIIKKLFFFISIFILYQFLQIYFFPKYFTIHCSSIDPVTVSTTVNINVDKEGAEAIASGLQSTGSQIGLGAAIGGLAAAASKSITGSALPPIQKVGLIGVAGIVGGLVHCGATAINRE